MPSLVYRVSFKATCLIYAPLIWVSHFTVGREWPLKTRLDHLRTGSDIEKVRRWWALILGGVALYKAMYLADWIPAGDLAKRIGVTRILEVFVLPNQIPPWQITVLINCALTFLIYWLAGEMLFRMKNPETAWSESRVERSIEGLTFSRGLLSLYNFFCGFYIVVVDGFQLPWPPLGTKFLPWL